MSRDCCTRYHRRCKLKNRFDIRTRLHSNRDCTCIGYICTRHCCYIYLCLISGRRSYHIRNTYQKLFHVDPDHLKTLLLKYILLQDIPMVITITNVATTRTTPRTNFGIIALFAFVEFFKIFIQRFVALALFAIEPTGTLANATMKIAMIVTAGRVYNIRSAVFALACCR